MIIWIFGAFWRHMNFFFIIKQCKKSLINRKRWLTNKKKSTQLNFKVDKNQNSSKTKKIRSSGSLELFFGKKRFNKFTKIRKICNALNKCVKSMCCATLEKTEEFLLKFVVLLNCVSSCFKIMNGLHGKIRKCAMCAKRKQTAGKMLLNVWISRSITLHWFFLD